LSDFWLVQVISPKTILQGIKQKMMFLVGFNIVEKIFDFILALILKKIKIYEIS
jgi:hypothetical protein